MVPHAQLPPSGVQGRGIMAEETQSKGVLRLGGRQRGLLPGKQVWETSDGVRP